MDTAPLHFAIQAPTNQRRIWNLLADVRLLWEMLNIPRAPLRSLGSRGVFAHVDAEPRTLVSRSVAVILGLTLMLAACGQGGSGSIRPSDRTIVRQVLQASPSHGFGANRFAADENKLTDEIIAYAAAQHGVDRDPATVVTSWGMRGERYDATAEFARAEVGGNLREWIASLPPSSTQYAALRTAFARYQHIAHAGGWPQLPSGAAPRIGASGPNVALLRQRLAVEVQLPPAPRADYFDAGLAQALRNAQTRYGLAATGALDDATRRALNVPAETRLTQIQANLQRWRWAPRHPNTTRIDVNVPSGAAAFYVDNAPRLQMRVAVGRPGDETPMLTSVIRSIVINPPWNVPDSIAERELLPREEREPGYLASHGFVQVSDDGQTMRLQQTPSPQSALGVVKFVFENSYGVYLHDTPSRAAFAQARRSVSHGCVRLERAVDLASMVLAAQGWSSERLRQTIAAGQTSEVRLETPIPVRIFYWTAWVAVGQVHFRDDIYGWDEATAALAGGIVRRPATVVAANAAAAPPASASAQAGVESNDYIPAQTLNGEIMGYEDLPQADEVAPQEPVKPDSTSEQTLPSPTPN